MSSIRPTFTGFEAAKAAIFTNQKSLDIVGNNLANVDTEGYTRQRVDRASIYVSTSSARVASSSIGLQGQGVEALGVSQMRDELLDNRFRNAYSTTSYHAAAADILTNLQNALGDGSDITDESGLSGSLQKIYEAINNYMSSPTVDSSANLVMSAFQSATASLRQMDTQLKNVQKQAIEDLGSTTDRINTIAQKLAELNETISSDSIVTTGGGNEYFQPNELLDSRNLLLDELSGYGDIKVTTYADGTADVSFGSHPLVSGKNSNQLTEIVGEDNTVKVAWLDSGETVDTTQGSVRAAMDYINGRGPNMQKSSESPERGILYYQDQLDTFATTLAKYANSAIPEMGEDGKPLEQNGEIVYKTLIGTRQSDGTVKDDTAVSASDITVSNKWSTEGAGYFIYSRDENVTKYAQQLCLNLTENDIQFSSFGEEFSGTFADFETNFLAQLGSDLGFQNGRQEATAAIAGAVEDSRDAISGVNQDEEATEMVKYQKSYQAAARLMTAMDDLLDILINKMGRVGL